MADARETIKDAMQDCYAYHGVAMFGPDRLNRLVDTILYVAGQTYEDGVRAGIEKGARVVEGCHWFVERRDVAALIRAAAPTTGGDDA